MMETYGSVIDYIFRVSASIILYQRVQRLIMLV